MSVRESDDLQKLLFRRQFIMGPRYVEELTSWKRISVGDRFFLTVHPDLDLEQAVDGKKSITLLGYILDPADPEATNKDLLMTLVKGLESCTSLDDFLRLTDPYGGRWILIVDDSSEIRMFTDPMGYRQVYYTNKYHLPDIWVGSQPGIIAEVLHLELDEEAVSQFAGSEMYTEWQECVWPGDDTPYKEVSHLLPNHYLNLRNGLCQRYWPDRALEKVSLEEAVEEQSRLLAQLVKSAAQRYDLGFTITAGWDSRLLLAASREVSDRSFYFSLWRPGSEKDAIVPSRLLPKLGLNHHIIHYPEAMDEKFEKIFMRNNTYAHGLWGRMAEGLFNDYPAGRLCVKGNASEILRTRFRLPEGQRLTAEDLCMFSGFGYGPQMAKIAYANRSWSKWLQAVEGADIYNVHVLDLYYWEHWAGNFGAMTQSEWDIVQEVYTPYNSRSLLVKLLSVPEKYRDHDDPILYREMAKRLWPEVLSEPVNPRDEDRTLRGKVKSLLVRNNLYQFVPERVKSWGRTESSMKSREE
jgi:hypothetical protein